MKTIVQFFIIVFLLTAQLVVASNNTNLVNVENSNTDTNVEVRYYYFPNLQAYYDLQNEVYIYKLRGVWIASDVIDSNYRGYSLNNTFYVEVKDYFGDEPHTMIDGHKAKYPANYSSKPQRVVASAY